MEGGEEVGGESPSISHPATELSSSSGKESETNVSTSYMYMLHCYSTVLVAADCIALYLTCTCRFSDS